MLVDYPTSASVKQPVLLTDIKITITMKAVVLQGNKGASVVNDRPVPKLRADYVLVDTKAVALNPTDWKHREYDATNFPGLLSGCDFAGVVEEVGSSVDKEWKKGDRICGFVQ